MDTSEVEKFFAVWPEDGGEKGEALKARAENIVLVTITLMLLFFIAQ